MDRKILTVDDSKMVRMIVEKTFAPYHCIVTAASDGAEGVEAALRDRPDIIFMDITMPVMTGLEALAKIRDTPEIAATPVVMLTAESDAQRLGAADQLKVAGYISKPFQGDQLVLLTHKLIGLTRKS